MDLNKVKKKIIYDLRNEIPELKDRTNDFKLKRLSSKKNIVCELIFDKKPKQLPKEVILKLFRTDYAEKEYQALIKLDKQGVRTPKVLFYRKPYIILTKLNGINLCDFINEKLVNVDKMDDLDNENREIIFLCITKLANWLSKLHKKNIINKSKNDEIVVFNKGDTRLRDFIFDEEKKIIYGLDFEESYEGNYLDDLAWICCSFIDTNPGIFEIPEPKHKIELLTYFLKEYFHFNQEFSFSFNYFADKLIDYLNIVIERRNLELSLVRKNVILKKILKL